MFRGPPGWLLDARLKTLLCERITVAKFKKVKRGSNLAEFCKEGYGSKCAVFSTMTMMISRTSETNFSDSLLLILFSVEVK
jgi:hypothetical protein